MTNKYMTTEFTKVNIHDSYLYDMLTENTHDLINMYENDTAEMNGYSITCEFNSYHWDDMADNDRWVDLHIIKKSGLITVAIRATFNYKYPDWDYEVTDVTLSDIYL